MRRSYDPPSTWRRPSYFKRWPSYYKTIHSCHVRERELTLWILMSFAHATDLPPLNFLSRWNPDVLCLTPALLLWSVLFVLCFSFLPCSAIFFSKKSLFCALRRFFSHGNSLNWVCSRFTCVCAHVCKTSGRGMALELRQSSTALIAMVYSRNRD